METSLKIYDVPSDRRYWVVRAEGGRYFDHFTKHSLIALGHLNWLNLPDTNNGDIFTPDLNSLKEKFKKRRELEEINSHRSSTHLAQVKAFLYEMSVGDWVMTVGSTQVKFGRIISSPFINRKEATVIYDQEKNTGTSMDFHLRREVQWGPSLSRKYLPYGLLRSLKANQTVFNLDANWAAVYHSLYPAFRRDNKLYLSAKIGTENQVKNHSIAAFLQLLNEVEVIGHELALGRSMQDFDTTYMGYLANDRVTITTKAQFNSPGDVWNVITQKLDGIDLDGWAIKTAIIYSMLFGNSVLGFDGLIDLQTRQKMWEMVLDRKKKNNAENVVESLALKLPKHDTKKLEDDSRDKH